jgi:putative OPT family oligopeptide transporter
MKPIPEFTLKAIVIGSILGIIFGAANAYLALKVGMTVSASIPAAVISMAILKTFFKKGTILENNIAQTIGSSGEALAAGIVFTIPAFFLVNAKISVEKIIIISILGGFLGILFMIPLRKYLIVEEHKKLPYPEGTACAEVLIAGDKGGTMAKTIFTASIIGGMYKLLMSGFKMWKETIYSIIPWYKGASIGIETTPALLGVGFIIGDKISCLVFAGGSLASFVICPIFSFLGEYLQNVIIPPADKPISSLSPVEIRSFYVRYIGVGAVALGGIVSLVKALPVIFSSFSVAIKEIFRKTKDIHLEDMDLPMWFVLLSSAIIILLIWLLPIFPLNLIGAIIVVVCSFLFVAVSSRIVGIIGSSANPVSGMTIATLILTSLIFLNIGFTGTYGIIASLSVGAIVCIAICMASDASQDLKTGYLVGATPYLQQIGEFIGVIIPALIMGSVIMLLHNTYIIGSDKLPAPQATLMAEVVKGIMAQSLPWILVIIGIFLGIVIELLGIPSLPFAIGLYLPFSLSTPILIGGLVYWIAMKIYKEKFKEFENVGIIYSSGLIAGDASAGIIIALLYSIPTLSAWQSSIKDNWLFGTYPSIFIFFFLAMSILFIKFFIRRNV